MSRREVLNNFKKYAEETREKVDYGINHYRKGNFCIKVTDKDRKAVKGAKLHLNQKTHEFKYGANIFMLDELENEEKNNIYKKHFADAFNMATLPFYWNDLEPERGKTRYEKDSPKIYRRPAPDLCMEFCEENDIEPREHALAYEYMFPNWAKKLPTPELKKFLTKRFEEISERYADKINTIEVTNEMFWPVSEDTSAFYEDEEYVEWCFKEAEKYFPDNELVINDWTDICWLGHRNRERYYMQIERALSKGARIDAIGMQYHMFCKEETYVNDTAKYYNPTHLYKVLDRYSKFNLPIQVTEVTVPAYTESEEDEAIQAEIIKNLYKIWFSHKNVEQIIYWNLVDGYAAFAPQGDMTSGENVFRGGLLRFDLTPKPAYYVIKDLFEKEWHTEVSLETDEEGKAYFSGFYGDYTVIVDGKEYVINAVKSIQSYPDGTKKIEIEI